MKSFKKCDRVVKGIIVLLFIALFSCGVFTVSAADSSYNYDAWDEEIDAPLGYTVSKTVNGIDLNIGKLNKPSDIYVSDDYDVYISDTENNRIIILNSEFKLKRIVDSIIINGEKSELKMPGGLFVDTNNEIYVTQKEKGRVLRMTSEGNVLDVYEKPASNLLDENFEYLPIKVIKSTNNSVYILSENYYYGALTYNHSGEFVGFYGSNKVDVTVDLLIDYAWKKISTKEQKDKMVRYVPIAYVSFDIDKDNFVYTCTQITKDSHDEIRKLNASGKDIINFYTKNMASSIGNFGDIKTLWLMGKSTDTQFVDICADDNGIINCLDYSRGRIFQYDDEGHLLNIFGGIGDSKDSFFGVSAIDNMGEKILVLDKEANSFTVFTPTNYTNTLHNALALYKDGMYAEAKPLWENLILENVNCEIAYTGLGRALYAEGKYKDAMSAFKKGYDRTGYSLAFKAQRKIDIRSSFPIIATTIMILLVLVLTYVLVRIFILKKPFIKREQKLTPVRRIMRAMIHPFDEFYDLKDTKQWCFPAALIILFSWFAVTVADKTLTGFIFNYNKPEDTNILFYFASTCLLYLLFVIINWAITTLTDGKGKMYEIFVSCTYALIPYIISILVNIILSNMFTAEEAAFYTFFQAVGFIWSFMLFLGALRAIHDYTFTKTIFCMVLTVAGMAFVIFLLILFVSLLQQFFLFGTSIFTELLYRG